MGAPHNRGTSASKGRHKRRLTGDIRWFLPTIPGRSRFSPRTYTSRGPKDHADSARAGYLDALGILADHASISHDHHTVIELAQRLLEADPYDSSAHQRLIGALNACGRHGDAQPARNRRTERMHKLGVPDN